jgi:hypothetical protein
VYADERETMTITPDDLINYIFMFLGFCLGCFSLGLLAWFWRKLGAEDEAARVMALRKAEHSLAMRKGGEK